MINKINTVVEEFLMTLPTRLQEIADRYRDFKNAVPTFLDDFLAPEGILTRKREVDRQVEDLKTEIKTERGNRTELSGEIDKLTVKIEDYRKTLEELRVGRCNAPFSANGDRLEVFHTHHRTAPSAASGPPIGDDCRVLHQVFPGGTDTGNPYLRIMEFIPQQILGVTRAQSPQVARVAYFTLAIVDPQKDRVGRTAGNDDGVVPGELHFRSEVASCRGAEVPTGEGRLERHDEA